MRVRARVRRVWGTLGVALEAISGEALDVKGYRARARVGVMVGLRVRVRVRVRVGVRVRVPRGTAPSRQSPSESPLVKCRRK